MGHCDVTRTRLIHKKIQRTNNWVHSLAQIGTRTFLLQKSKTAISRLVFIGSNNSVGKQAKLKEITGNNSNFFKRKKQKNHRTNSEMCGAEGASGLGSTFFFPHLLCFLKTRKVNHTHSFTSEEKIRTSFSFRFFFSFLPGSSKIPARNPILAEVDCLPEYFFSFR